MPVSPQSFVFDHRLVLPIIGRVLRTKSFYGVVLIGLLLTAVRAYRSQPVFRSEVVLRYEDRGGSNPLVQRETPSSRRIAITLRETLFSRALLERLIHEFGLYQPTVSRLGLVPAVERMQRFDLHFAGHEGYSYRVMFDSPSPDLAQSVAARAADLLMRAQTEAREKEAQETSRFLQSESERVEKELRKNEAELALFVAKHPEVVEADLLRAGAALPDTSAAESASLGLEMQALQLRERLAQLRRSPSSASLSASSGRPVSEARQRAEAELAAAQRELAERQTQFTEAHPDVRRAAARVATARASLRHLDESPPAAPSRPPVARPAETPSPEVAPEARVVQEQLELLQKQVRAVRSQSRRSRGVGPSDPVAFGRLRAQYVELERRTRESRDHHDLLENRQFQAEMQALFATQAKRGDLIVVDPAFRPVLPLRSSRFKILLLGSAGSLFLALLVSLVVVLRDDRLRAAVDLRRFDLPPMLCEIPPS